MRAKASAAWWFTDGRSSKEMMARWALLAAAAVSAACGSADPGSAGKEQAQPTALSAHRPAGTESLGVEWRMIHSPGGGTIQLAIARPVGDGPFPAVVILHGSHGFAREYVELARDLSRGGVVAVAACWFAPGSGPGTRFVTPVPCPADTPPRSDHLSRQASRTIETVVAAVRTLPGVEPHRIALFGHSRGGGAVWNFVLQGGDAQAIILNSAGYPDDLIQRAAQIGAATLILHGDKDGPGDPSGGGTMTDVRRAKAFQNALLKAGKPVEAVYYPTGQHNSLFANPLQRADEVQRMRVFLDQYLRRN